MKPQQIFREVQAVRNVTDSNFPRGQIHIPFSIQSGESFIPSESYLRIKYSLTKGDGTTLLYADGVGPNIYLGDSLFQQQEMYANNKCVSRINDFVHQIGAIKNRVCVPHDFNETYGDSLYLPQAELNERVNLVAQNRGGYERIRGINYAGQITIGANNDANKVTLAGGINGTLNAGDEILVRSVDANRNVTTVITSVLEVADNNNFTTVDDVPDANGGALNTNGDRLLILNKTQAKRRFQNGMLIYKPSLGFFDVDCKIGGGRYDLVLTPNTEAEFQRKAIESFAPKISGPLATNIKFEIKEMVLYISCYDTSGATSCMFKEVECQKQTINSNSLVQKEYELIQPARMLAVAFQDNNSGNASNLSAGKFKITDDVQNSLNLFYIRYNNTQLPDPQSQLVKDGNTDHMVDRYYENLRYAGKNILKYSVEPIDIWFDKGIYFLFKYSKATQRRVIVNTKFTNPFPNADGNRSISCLLFSWYNKNVSW